MALEAIQVIQDLAIVMVVALGMALLSYLIHQPPLIGYIIAGIIIGPFTPPAELLQHPEVLNLFAEVGIVFLLFAVGMEYPVARLRAVGRIALVIALVESLGTFAAGCLVGLAFGFSQFDSLFLGLAVSVTSTVILSKVLEEYGVLRDDAAGLILGITILEDIVIVSALGVLQSVAQSGGVSPLAVGIGIGGVALFVGLSLALGTRLVPRFIDQVARVGRSDLLLIAVLGVAFVLSFFASLLGISVATGAFLGGVMVAESRNAQPARDLVAPLRELFGAIFFVSMGALMDIELIPAYLVPILALLAVAFVSKYVATYVACRGQGIPARGARRTALGLAGPGGEVSLTVAKGGADVQAISPVVLPIIGILTLLTAILTPSRVRLAWRGGREPVLSRAAVGSTK